MKPQASKPKIKYLGDSKLPLYIKENLKVGQKTSVTYRGMLMNCKILSKIGCFYRWGNSYWVEVLEYPAQKGIHL